MIGGIRFIPTPIKRYVIEDQETGQFFCGWHDNCRWPTMQSVHWLDSPKLRREYDTYEEAEIEAALIVQMGCRGNRNLEVSCAVLL